MIINVFVKRVLVWILLAVVPPAVFSQVKIEAVVNAASFQPGLPMGGALATVFVSGLNAPPVNAKPGTYTANSLPLPYELGGVSVGVDGQFYAPILGVSIPEPGSPNYAQINFQVPLERNVSLGATNGFIGSLSVLGASISPLPLRPEYGGFFGDASRYAIAQHASDFSAVTQENPAHAGETVIAYADDIFEVWPEPAMGLPAPHQPIILGGAPFSDGALPGGKLYLQSYPVYTPANPITHQGGGYFPTTPAVATTFLGLAPGQIGVEQVNFIVPKTQQPGDWALFFSNGAGGASPYVVLPVR